MKMHPSAPVVALLYLVASTAQAIELGLFDDFEGDSPGNCATDGWTEGVISANPPTAEPGCGVAESCCLANDSAGGSGPGSRQATFNEGQWSGNYVAAGVNKIAMRIANPGSAPLVMRVGMSDGGTCYVSTNGVTIAAGATLASYSFLLTAEEMTPVSGNLCGGLNELADVLSNVIQLRVVAASDASWAGDAITSTVQFDEITATADTDMDGVNDDVDNCTLVSNPAQTDADGDNYGNACDPDLNNDCRVNFFDLGIMTEVFFSADAIADLDGNGTVNFADLAVMKQSFFGAPGPGLGSCVARGR